MQCEFFIRYSKLVEGEREDAFAIITPDGNHFFFHSLDLEEREGMANIFWMDALHIESLRPKQ
ncbi:MAG: hypothetical protein ACJA1Z_000229 [Patiriisocius sp.]|jgi:hypothetical protein